MADIATCKISVDKDVPTACNLCCFPSWSIELRSDGEHEVNLNSFDDVKASAETGCAGCKLLVEAWQFALPDDVERKKSELVFNVSWDNLHIHVFRSRVHGIEAFTLQGEPSLLHLRVASLLPPTTHLRHNLSRIQTWLSACERNHPSCRETSSYMPPRLLDIGLADRNTVKLVDISSMSNITPRYACLSHCWGRTRSKHITHAENLETNMTGILISELPKTFKEAIEIARALQLRYLWIDSLCIVQNNKNDWATHVGAMTSIYENAYITLAAGASSDDDGGFFAEAHERCAKPHLLKLETGSQSYNIYIRYGIDHPDAQWPATEILPIMKRGWCVQERLLSRRYLCFGAQEILWECLEDVACSCSMAGGPFNPRTPGAIAKFKDSPATKIQMSLPDADHNMIWRNLVTEYSSRRLTYPHDKLPALAGLANAFQRKFKTGPYMLGLWTDSLNQDLRWYSSGTEAPAGRPRKGPSWSWVYSADCQIEWPKLYENDYSQLQGLFGQDSKEDEAGKMPLSLSGILLSVSIQTWTEREDFEIAYPSTRYCRVFEHTTSTLEPSIHQPKDHTTHFPLLPGLVYDKQQIEEPNKEDHIAFDGHFHADYRFWEEEEELREELQPVIFAILGVENTESGDEDETCWVAGMILKLNNEGVSTENDIPRYERIGWLRYHTEKKAKDFVPAGNRTTYLLV